MTVSVISNVSEHVHEPDRSRRMANLHDVFILFNEPTICVGFSAQMSWLVFLFLGGSGFLDDSGTHVAVCRHRACGSRALRGMEMAAA